jgi:hypothetical protein
VDLVSDNEKTIHLEGIVHARRYDPGAGGKQFLGVTLECSEEKVWVIDYEEQSPFHAFAGRRVVVSGESCKPHGQRLGWLGRKKQGHFRVRTLRAAEVLGVAEIVGVGAELPLRGRFERASIDTGDANLSFVTEHGDVFLVANDPAGASVGGSVEVRAYPVQPSPWVPMTPAPYLWIICPYSDADIREWRERRSSRAIL